jgi:tetratricopeptide (TPR) repeat protein
MLCRDGVTDPTDRDAEHWEAVENAVELLMSGDHHEALAELRDIIARDPENAYAYHHTGTAMFELERYEAARDAYRAAVRLAPRYLGARIGLVHALRLIGDADGAVAEAREALKLFPDDADATFALGVALGARGERREAVRTLRKFLALNPELEVQLEVQGIIDMLQQEPEGTPFVWK